MKKRWIEKQCWIHFTDSFGTANLQNPQPVCTKLYRRIPYIYSGSIQLGWIYRTDQPAFNEQMNGLHSVNSYSLIVDDAVN